MRATWISVAAATLLAGCVAPPAGSYVSPLEQANNRLREASMRQVALLSRQTMDFLAAGKSDDDAITQAQKKLGDSLKDPGAAQFKNVRMTPYLDGKVICGEVNGKNSYGAYVGFKPFVASPIDSTLLSTGSRYKSTDDLANAGLRAACGS